MSGTFSSLSSALSALRYNRVAMDVASGNVANADTAGYARRQVDRPGHRRPGAARPVVPWRGRRRRGGAQLGVAAGRPADGRPLARRALPPPPSSTPAPPRWSGSRPRSTSRARAVSPRRCENFAAWHDVANPAGARGRHPASGPRRHPRSTLATQAQRLGNEMVDQRTRLDALGSDVNQTAAQLADLNKGLRAASSDRHRRRHAARPARPAHPEARHPDRRRRDRQRRHHRRRQGRRPGRWSPATRPVRRHGAPARRDLAGAAADPVTSRLNGTAVTLSGGRSGPARAAEHRPPRLPRQAGDSFVATMADRPQRPARGRRRPRPVPPAARCSPGPPPTDPQVAITDPRSWPRGRTRQGGLDDANADALADLRHGSRTPTSGLVTGFGVAVSSAQQAVGQPVRRSPPRSTPRASSWPGSTSTRRW